MMECHECKEDYPFYELQWNGRYTRTDSFFRIGVERKVQVCETCFEKYGFRINKKKRYQ